MRKPPYSTPKRQQSRDATCAILCSPGASVFWKPLSRSRAELTKLQHPLLRCCKGKSIFLESSPVGFGVSIGVGRERCIRGSLASLPEISSELFTTNAWKSRCEISSVRDRVIGLGMIKDCLHVLDEDSWLSQGLCVPACLSVGLSVYPFALPYFLFWLLALSSLLFTLSLPLSLDFLHSLVYFFPYALSVLLSAPCSHLFCSLPLVSSLRSLSRSVADSHALARVITLSHAVSHVIAVRSLSLSPSLDLSLHFGHSQLRPIRSRIPLPFFVLMH